MGKRHFPGGRLLPASSGSEHADEEVEDPPAPPEHSDEEVEDPPAPPEHSDEEVIEDPPPAAKKIKREEELSSCSSSDFGALVGLDETADSGVGFPASKSNTASSPVPDIDFSKIDAQTYSVDVKLRVESEYLGSGRGNGGAGDSEEQGSSIYFEDKVVEIKVDDGGSGATASASFLYSSGELYTPELRRTGLKAIGVHEAHVSVEGVVEDIVARFEEPDPPGDAMEQPATATDPEIHDGPGEGKGRRGNKNKPRTSTWNVRSGKEESLPLGVGEGIVGFGGRSWGLAVGPEEDMMRSLQKAVGGLKVVEHQENSSFVTVSDWGLGQRHLWPGEFLAKYDETKRPAGAGCGGKRAEASIKPQGPHIRRHQRRSRFSAAAAAGSATELTAASGTVFK